MNDGECQQQHKWYRYVLCAVLPRHIMQMQRCPLTHGLSVCLFYLMLLATESRCGGHWCTTTKLALFVLALSPSPTISGYHQHGEVSETCKQESPEILAKWEVCASLFTRLSYRDWITTITSIIPAKWMVLLCYMCVVIMHEQSLGSCTNGKAGKEEEDERISKDIV